MQYPSSSVLLRSCSLLIFLAHFTTSSPVNQYAKHAARGYSSTDYESEEPPAPVVSVLASATPVEPISDHPTEINSDEIVPADDYMAEDDSAQHQPAPEHTPAEYSQPESTPTQYYEPESTPTENFEPEYTTTESSEPEYTPTENSEPEYTPTESSRPEYTSTEHPEPVYTSTEHPEPEYTPTESSQPEYTPTEHSQPEYIEPEDSSVYVPETPCGTCLLSSDILPIVNRWLSSFSTGGLWELPYAATENVQYWNEEFTYPNSPTPYASNRTELESIIDGSAKKWNLCTNITFEIASAWNTCDRIAVRWRQKGYATGVNEHATVEPGTQVMFSGIDLLTVDLNSKKVSVAETSADRINYYTGLGLDPFES